MLTRALRISSFRAQYRAVKTKDSEESRIAENLKKEVLTKDYEYDLEVY